MVFVVFLLKLYGNIIKKKRVIFSFSENNFLAISLTLSEEDGIC